MDDTGKAFERFDRWLEERFPTGGLPGMAVALTDRESLVRVATYGFSDPAAGTPVAPGTLFEIGSIGKSFSAIALLQLRDEGRIDLHAPVERYLPWFRVRSAHAPISLHHLLSHTAGIIRGADVSPDARYEVWAARETEAGGPPGERFHYSNLGYKALGLVLAEVEGKPYGQVVQERILDPLEMTSASPIITHETRKRLAVGHRSFYDDRPARATDPLVPATWLETDTADGCIATTAEDLATFLRMLLNRGVAPSGPLLSEAGFAAMTQAAIPAWPGATYGYGLATMTIDGHACFSHGGGMVGYHSGMLGDLDEGIGVVVLVNGPPTPVQEALGVAYKLLRAVRRGEEPPPFPTIPDPRRVDDAVDFAGTYRSRDDSLVLIAEGRQLILEHGGARLPLEKHGADAFLVDHEDLVRFPLRFGRQGERVVEACHGSRWFAREGYADQDFSTAPPAWAAYPGHYRAHNPWVPNFRVVLRKGVLLLVQPSGEEEVLSAREDGTFRIGEDPASPERVRFDAVLDGQALRAQLGGGDFYRFFTP